MSFFQFMNIISNLQTFFNPRFIFKFLNLFKPEQYFSYKRTFLWNPWTFFPILRSFCNPRNSWSFFKFVIIFQTHELLPNLCTYFQFTKSMNFSNSWTFFKSMFMFSNTWSFFKFMKLSHIHVLLRFRFFSSWTIF